MSEPTPQKEVWYQWKVYSTVEGEGEPRLLTPWSDPMKYEFAFDFLYKTPSEAMQGLKDYEVDPIESFDWVLVKTTYEPMLRPPSN